jgi:nucleoside-diphosphate-sugar epimerase
MSFSPKELAETIKKFIPEFKINYKPDSRQEIANSWPESIDDSLAKNDWGWKAKINLDNLVKSMLQGLRYPV